MSPLAEVVFHAIFMFTFVFIAFTILSPVFNTLLGPSFKMNLQKSLLFRTIISILYGWYASSTLPYAGHYSSEHNEIAVFDVRDRNHPSP